MREWSESGGEAMSATTGMRGTVVPLTALPLKYRALRVHLTALRESVHPERTVFEVDLLPNSPWWWRSRRLDKDPGARQ